MDKRHASAGQLVYLGLAHESHASSIAFSVEPKSIRRRSSTSGVAKLAAYARGVPSRRTETGKPMGAASPAAPIFHRMPSV
jgi:hypothetical protein